MAGNLAALLQRVSLDDHEERLKIANNALKQSKNDAAAQHIRLVALIKLDRYDDAIRALDQIGEPLKSKATLEWAYALYRTNQLQEAERVLQAGQSTRGSAFLEAQTAYRLEDFTRADRIYKELGDQGQLDLGEETDLRVNRGAIDAQLAWSGQTQPGVRPKFTAADLERFDMAFNAACSSMARGEFKQAEFLLKRAKALCSADEDLSEEERRDELLPIDAQLVYILIVLGKNDEAKTLCASLRVQEYESQHRWKIAPNTDQTISITDSATKSVARANQLLASGAGSNPYLAQRLFGEASQAPTKQQPFRFQQSLLRQNKLALDLAANKYGSVANAARADQSAVLENAWVGVFDAAAHARNQTGKQAIKEILPVLEQRPHDVGLVLTVVQLYVLTNNVQTATSLLEGFLGRLEASDDASKDDVRFAPGLVAAMATLLARQNRIAPAKTELAKAARHWRHRQKEGTVTSSLLQAAGAALLDSASEEDMAFSHELFEAMASEQSGSPVSTAGLIASQAEASTVDDSSIPTVCELIEGIDVEALEHAGIAKPAVRTAGHTATKRPAETASKPAKNKKVRKSRMPRDFDPEKKLDAERWLPMRDRSYFRPKGKKKNKSQGGGGGGTQGGLAEDGAKATTQSTVQQASQKPGGASKSKKKKGKGK